MNALGTTARLARRTFLRFALTDDQAAGLRDAATPVMVGCNHPLYGHLAMLNDETRAELAKDLA